MAEYEIPEDTNELKDWVKETEARSRDLRDNVLPEFNKEIEDTRKQEVALLAQVKELQIKRRRAENSRDLAKAQIKKDEGAVTAGKRKLETLLSEEAIKSRLAAEAEEFDKITQHYQWREFAFSHQIDGARRLATARRGILGDKRGLGKSLTSLIWADMLEAKKVLIFAPKDVLLNFKREIEHWTPHRHVAVLGGMPKVQRELFLNILQHEEQFLILCNYEAWRKDPTLVDHIINLRADTVIIDEAHNIKEKKTSAYKGIREIVYAQNKCSLCDGVPEQYRNNYGSLVYRCSNCLYEPTKFNEFCSVKNILPMTGTAILNRPQDLFTLLNLVDRVLFPSEKAFLEDYCMTDYDTGRWRFRPGGEEALIKKLGSKFVRRDKKSAGVATMPQTVIAHEIEFDKGLYAEQWKVMKQIADFGAIKMAENVRLDIIGVLPEILRRRQAITWPAGIKIWEEVKDSDGILRKTGKILYEAPAAESIKMDKALELAKEIVLEEEDRLVIFSQFKEALKELERRLNGLDIPVARYDGDTSDAKAQAIQLDFDIKTAANHPKGRDCNPECPNWSKREMCFGYRYQVIVAHYKKGGVGLNLNAARQMIILDREWSPGKEDQAVGRIDRMDNTHSTVVHTLHVPGTIDGFMDSLIEEKKRMIDGFEAKHDLLDSLKSALTSKDLL